MGGEGAGPKEKKADMERRGGTHAHSTTLWFLNLLGKDARHWVKWKKSRESVEPWSLAILITPLL